MTEDESTNKYDGDGLRGPLYWLAAAATASAVKGPGGILGNLLGGNPPVGPDAPVTQKVLDLTSENQTLKSQLYTNELDKRQSVWNAAQQARIDCLEAQVGRLYGMTQLTIPNGNLNPGYGTAVVSVAPPPTTPDVATLAAAIAAAMKSSTTPGS